VDYSLAAGVFVTLSFLFLLIETRLNNWPAKAASGWLIAYLAGVLCWLILGVLMDQAALVLISMLQLLFLSLYYSEKKTDYE